MTLAINEQISTQEIPQLLPANSQLFMMKIAKLANNCAISRSFPMIKSLDFSLASQKLCAVAETRFQECPKQFALCFIYVLECGYECNGQFKSRLQLEWNRNKKLLVTLRNVKRRTSHPRIKIYSFTTKRSSGFRDLFLDAILNALWFHFSLHHNRNEHQAFDIWIINLTRREKSVKQLTRLMTH